MGDLQFTLSAAWDLLCMEFTIYGFTMSFRSILIWGIVAGLLIWFIREVFS